MQSKRGLSDMVSYVLLIVIAISLSVAVYTYLKLYLPSERAECPADISLAVQSLSCENGQLSVSLSNRGLFNVSGAYVRMSKPGRIVKSQLNKDREVFLQPLSPEKETDNLVYSTQQIVSDIGNYDLEIQPAILSDRILIPCERISTQKIACSPFGVFLPYWPGRCGELYDLINSTFGNNCDDGQYNPAADINNDGVIDPTDRNSLNDKFDAISADDSVDSAWCEAQLDDSTDPCEVDPPQPFPELTRSQCTNGIDDDLDGGADCNDPDKSCCWLIPECAGSPLCIPGDIVDTAEKECSDHTDNDGDGLVNCADPDCAGIDDCPEPQTFEPPPGLGGSNPDIPLT